MKSKVIVEQHSVVAAEPWSLLKHFTEARIGLGRAGVSLPTKAQIEFNLHHALARDAVNIPSNMDSIADALRARQINSFQLHSKAQDRRQYLQRPDLGRSLNQVSSQILQKHAEKQLEVPDVALLLVDGLSSTGIQQQGTELCSLVNQQCVDAGYKVSPVCLIEQGRVAIGDEVGSFLKARAVILIVGERPGLSSPDSVGIYFTYAPEPGLTDARRNCISNIRPGGLSLQEASDKCLWLLQQAFQLKLSGVELKDTSQITDTEVGESLCQSFLIPAQK